MGDARAGIIELTYTVGAFTRELSDDTMKDLWLALTFGEPTLPHHP